MEDPAAALLAGPALDCDSIGIAPDVTIASAPLTAIQLATTH
jgi:hypothetical protein